jgi:hypothetical protein
LYHKTGENTSRRKTGVIRGFENVLKLPAGVRGERLNLNIARRGR